MEQRLHDLLSTPENDLDFFNFMDIGRVRKTAAMPRDSSATEKEFAQVLRQAIDAIRSKSDLSEKRAA